MRTIKRAAALAYAVVAANCEQVAALGWLMAGRSETDLAPPRAVTGKGGRDEGPGYGAGDRHPPGGRLPRARAPLPGAPGFPVRDASSTVGQLRASVQRQALMDGPWHDAGSLVVLAGVMFGAARGGRGGGQGKKPR